MKRPTAFEWHNPQTGHCYVDYIAKPQMGEEDGYTKIPLYHQLTEIKFPDNLDKVNAERAYPMKKYPYTNVSDLMLHADKINTAGEGFRDGIDRTINWMRENNNLKDENSL